jgi:hypothetical protein
MDTTLEKLKKYFPALPPNAIAKIYRARCARLRLLMNHRIPEDIRWLIEAKVRLSSESSNSWKRSFIFPLGPNCTFTINL